MQTGYVGTVHRLRFDTSTPTDGGLALSDACYSARRKIPHGIRWTTTGVERDDESFYGGRASSDDIIPGGGGT